MDRRRILASVFAALPLPRFAAAQAQPRSVFDLEAEIDVNPYEVRCKPAVVTASGATATVTAQCRMRPGTRVPRRGLAVEMLADVSYRQSGEYVGDCSARRTLKQSGPFSLTCDLALPPRSPLPIALTGAGNGTTREFVLPGGMLAAEIDFEGTGGDYFSARVIQDSGNTDYLAGAYGPLVGYRESFEVYETTRAYVEVSAEGGAAWTLTIQDAFPEQ